VTVVTAFGLWELTAGFEEEPEAICMEDAVLLESTEYLPSLDVDDCPLEVDASGIEWFSSEICSAF